MTSENPKDGSGRKLRLVATEECFACKEWEDAMARLATGGWKDLDLDVLRMFIAGDPPATTDPGWDAWWRRLTDKPPVRGQDDAFIAWFRKMRTDFFDIDAGRIAQMDEAGIDVMVLSLSLGVQMFEPYTATALATTTNDVLAEAVKKHPTRFAGLAAFAPQQPKEAAKEVERAIKKLGLHGLIVYSHTNGEYLDDPKFWPIFEAACAVDAPIYLHPRDPPAEARRMLTLASGRVIQSTSWGFQMETGLHAARLLYSDVFKQFPKLKIVLGHMGEGIPYWLWRLDWASQLGPRRPSETFKENFYITTSGASNTPLAHEVLRYCHSVLGPDRIMFAVDYPFADMKQAAAFMRSAKLPEEDLEKMASRNAERIFRIPPAR